MITIGTDKLRQFIYNLKKQFPKSIVKMYDRAAVYFLSSFLSMGGFSSGILYWSLGTRICKNYVNNFKKTRTLKRSPKLIVLQILHTTLRSRPGAEFNLSKDIPRYRTGTY